MTLAKTMAGIAFVLLLFQAGCGTAETPAQMIPEDDGQKYTIRVDSYTDLVFDSSGKEVPPEQQFTVLYDKISGLPQCQKRTLVEDSGEDTKYGTPVLRRTTALYDMEGNLLRDFEEADYEECFGDFLIRHDPRGFIVEIADLPKDYHTELWNFKTGETVLDSVGNVELMNEENSRFLMTDAYGELLGVANREGGVVSGFPAPEGYYYATAWSGMVIASNQPFDYDGQSERKEFLLTEALTPVLSREWLNSRFIGLHGNYLLFSESERKGIMDARGNEIYTPPEGEDIAYFDGELVILSKNLREQSGQPRSFSQRLVKTDGTELATDYDSLEGAVGQNEKAASQQFLARRGDEIFLLNRKGKVVASNQIPDAESVNFTGDLIVCRTDKESEALLNDKLEVLIEPGTYSWIRRVGGWKGGKLQKYDLLDCAYYIGGEQGNSQIMRHDVLDFSLNKVVGGLTKLADSGPNRLAVVRGFSAGLMDWEGNWIVRKSIFQNLKDDYDERSALF